MSNHASPLRTATRSSSEPVDCAAWRERHQRDRVRVLLAARGPRAVGLLLAAQVLDAAAHVRVEPAVRVLVAEVEEREHGEPRGRDHVRVARRVDVLHAGRVVLQRRAAIDRRLVGERAVVALVEREPRQARVDRVEQADRVPLAQLLELVHPAPLGLVHVGDRRVLVVLAPRAAVLDERAQDRVGPVLRAARPGRAGQQEAPQVARQLVEVLLVARPREHLRGRRELPVEQLPLRLRELRDAERLLELGLLATREHRRLELRDDGEPRGVAGELGELLREPLPRVERLRVPALLLEAHHLGPPDLEPLPPTLLRRLDAVPPGRQRRAAARAPSRPRAAGPPRAPARARRRSPGASPGRRTRRRPRRGSAARRASEVEDRTGAPTARRRSEQDSEG